jgi:hypothetical protein
MRLFTLKWPQFVALVLGLCGIFVVLAIIPMRDISEALDHLDLKGYEQEFGFEVGLVPATAFNGPSEGWGIASVTPGGWMDRAGVRSGDVVFERHGYDFGELRWAIERAAAGETACFVVSGPEDRFRTGRDVCLEGRRSVKPDSRFTALCLEGRRGIRNESYRRTRLARPLASSPK